jgi:hypothetical protein
MGQARWLKPVILVTWETEIGRIVVQGQPRKIFTRPYLKQCWQTLLIPAVQGARNERITVQAGLVEKVRPYLKI